MKTDIDTGRVAAPRPRLRPKLRSLARRGRFMILREQITPQPKAWWLGHDALLELSRKVEPALGLSLAALFAANTPTVIRTFHAALGWNPGTPVPLSIAASFGAWIPTWWCLAITGSVFFGTHSQRKSFWHGIGLLVSAVLATLLIPNSVDLVLLTALAVAATFPLFIQKHTARRLIFISMLAASTPIFVQAIGGSPYGPSYWLTGVGVSLSASHVMSILTALVVIAGVGTASCTVNKMLTATKSSLHKAASPTSLMATLVDQFSDAVSGDSSPERAAFVRTVDQYLQAHQLASLALISIRRDEHSSAEAAMAAAAIRLACALRDEHVMAQVDSRHFAVLMGSTPEVALGDAKRIAAALNLSHESRAGKSLGFHARVSIADSVTAGNSGSALLRAATTALDTEKHSDRVVHVFDADPGQGAD